MKLNHIIDLKDDIHGITAKEYGYAMNNLFDRWFNDYSAVEVDPFSQIIGNLVAGKPSGCQFVKSCRDSFISIGPNGDIYPCGRFDGLSDFWMGNVNERNGLRDALNSPAQKKLTSRSTDNLAGCPDCKYVSLCNGGCPHNAFVYGDVLGKDPFCAGYRMMYEHIEQRVSEELNLAKTIKKSCH